MDSNRIDKSIKSIIVELNSLSNPSALQGMASFGITPGKAYGVAIPELRRIAKSIGKDHELAASLWAYGYRETQILASMVDDVRYVTEEQMEQWVSEFDYWEICDQCCMNLFEDMPCAYDKAAEWSHREEEFVKRAGFVLMARLAVSDKEASDERFIAFFPIIKEGASDKRNFVKKAVNWALRQIGKRDLSLNSLTIELAEELQQTDSISARWVATDAIRELTGEKVQQKLRSKKAK
ncbi:MAG: DNA alkylation repair enzyme [Methanomethylovorans sp. PtaU1.Bin093]|uniref:DNA alkylation repair protein n=1 Tax=Methanomethylovorans sp. PtaU1.Bin093 TaxID=1811679 RepID=UPI0009CF2ED3|nr:DNA alkylation repair protein [Methanomethylovorans sp. PtaU1.Bin093]OPY21965.1 MAG: DNA alkylation repair enzyme [Methanomethylovorans sp. PtaU1.Bin093]